MHFHLDFTEQLNRLAEAFHKYEIDEVKLDKYSKNDLKCPFLGPGLPAVCGLWVQQRGPALQEWPSGQDGLHCHEVGVFLNVKTVSITINFRTIATPENSYLYEDDKYLQVRTYFFKTD